MPKFAANVSMLWPELDIYDRFAAAAEAGFSRIEILFVHMLDLDRIERLLREHHLELLQFNPAAGDWDAGERGVAWDPGRQEEFQRTLRGAFDTARRLNVRRLNVLTGIPAAGVIPSDIHGSIVENFRQVAPQAESFGITLQVENINNTDFPGYYVNTVERAAAIVSDVDRPNVRVQFDQYHVGMMGGDAPALVRRYGDLVSHVQIADVPGRHEPGTGQQPIPQFLAELDRMGYGGAVGLEYRPSADTTSALAWLPRDQRE